MESNFNGQYMPEPEPYTDADGTTYLSRFAVDENGTRVPEGWIRIGDTYILTPPVIPQ